jgi:hypothetical protein
MYLLCRCNVSLRGNGMKVLTANSHIPANTPVIECRGKYMLASQLAGRARGGDYVLYHRIAPDLEVCVESKTYGNDSRFCRRADTVLSDCNAEVRYFNNCWIIFCRWQWCGSGNRFFLTPLESG